MAKQTRRVQVFVCEEASGALDWLTAHKWTQTNAVEVGLLRLYRHETEIAALDESNRQELAERRTSVDYASGRMID